MSEWISIDSAPKDGTEIVAAEGDLMTICSWDGEAWRDRGLSGAAGVDPFEPELWQHKPQLPAVQAVKAKVDKAYGVNDEQD